MEGQDIAAQDRAAAAGDMTTDAEKSAPYPMVVGIGASAGGLAALKELFAHVPKNSGLAYVVIIHLSPDSESRLADVLQPHAAIPVRQVTETTPLEPDQVYVIPPGHNLSAIDTHLRLTEIEDELLERSPVNHFFRTLAATHDGRSIGVILSGTGSDGTLGIRNIHEQGGLTIVQDPAEAEYDGMPQNAVASGVVDLILPLAEIADAIIRFATTEPDVPLDISEKDSEAEQRQLVQKIFVQLHSRTGRDFSRYKESTILRRIRRRMQLLQVVELRDYLKLLRSDGEEVDALADDLLITVTHFFRDPDVFENLASQVIPALFGEGANKAIRVWSVGCATGEEAYSLAMLLLEEAGRRERPDVSLQIFATDLHDGSLERAREGIYSSDIEAGVGAARLQRFFTREGDAYRVRKEVRERVVFAGHNLLRDPPFSRMDLIVCRNLLIYLRRDTQLDVLELFHHSLNRDGFLVLGSSESLEIPDLFEVVDKRHAVFQKRDVPTRELKLPVFPVSISKPKPGRPRESHADSDAYEKLHRKLLESYAPPSLLVSPEGSVVHLSRGAGRYLEHPGGRPTAKVLELVRSELRTELRSLLHIANRRNEPHRSLPIAVHFDGEARLIVMHVQPDVEAEQPAHTLVVFDELAAAADERANIADQHVEGDDQLATMEVELAQTRERLESMLEEYESSQEEMRASNEELQSMNEELRSTLEELETNKEELQSMNEELQTVNQENRHKVDELAQLTSDLQNLLTATDIATLFLDRDLRILRFTPKVSELFSVRATDRGRPLSDLSHRLGDKGINEDASNVLKTLVPVEREISDEENRWYLVRLLPYRSQEDRIQGVVITFIEITQRKNIENRLRQSEHKYRQLAKDLEDEKGRLRATLDNMPVALWLSDSNGTIILANDLARTLYAAAEAGPAAETDLHAAWQVITGTEENREDGCVGLALGGETFTNVTAEYERPDGDTGTRLCSVTPVRTADRSIIGAVMAVQDISTVRRTEKALRRSETSLQRLAESLEHRVEQRTAQVNALARQLTVAEQEERRRVSMILHDDLQQLLHAISMKLQIIREDIGRAAKRELRQMIDDAAERIDIAITTSRNLTLDLTPPILRSEGLPEALRWLGHQMGELHGMDISVKTDSDFAVDDYAIRALAFQTVREILFNVKKHAGTNRAEIVLEQGDRPAITISDKGEGFDTAFLDSGELPGAGFGLVTLRERLRLVGGSLDVISQPGDGTRVIIYLPEAEPPSGESVPAPGQ